MRFVSGSGWGDYVERLFSSLWRLVGLVVVGSGLAAGALIPTAASAAGPAPPFTQCPNVGQSASCKVLLVVNADTTVSVYDDPAVGDYDGGDDTLVGITNNSNAYIPAVTVTGPGSDLAGFDGDGLCTYVTCFWPAPTGYEGPGTTFTVDPSDLDTAEVDFDGGGLGPGQWTYFSLEGTLTSATLTARKGGLGTYAALGDSYSSGEMGFSGVYSYNSQLPKNHCHRSSNAYGPLLDAAHSLGALTFAACSGAITADFFDPNHEGNVDPNTGALEAPQTTVLASSTKTITFTVGGNDVGFADVLAGCIIARVGPRRVYGSPGCSSRSSITDPVYQRLRALDGTGSANTPRGVPIHTLLSVIEAAHNKAPSAHIFVSGYPRLFGSFKGECGIGTVYSNKTIAGFSSPAAVKMLSNDAAWLNSVADLLNQVVSDATALARNAGIDATQVNPTSQFATHRLCDSKTAWIAGVSGSVDTQGAAPVAHIDSGSFHPTIDGQKAYQTAFESAGLDG